MSTKEKQIQFPRGDSGFRAAHPSSRSVFLINEKEKSRSGECETSGDTDGSTTESDESGNRPKKKARTGEDFLENLDGEEEDPG
ncbi:hypothetical protein YC2023_060374 [Brassica napus]